MTIKKARGYKSKLAEARVDTEVDSKGHVRFLPSVAMVAESGENPPTEAQFRRELIRLDKWIDQTLLWLDQFRKS